MLENLDSESPTLSVNSQFLKLYFQNQRYLCCTHCKYWCVYCNCYMKIPVYVENYTFTELSFVQKRLHALRRSSHFVGRQHLASKGTVLRWSQCCHLLKTKFQLYKEYQRTQRFASIFQATEALKAKSNPLHQIVFGISFQMVGGGPKMDTWIRSQSRLKIPFQSQKTKGNWLRVKLIANRSRSFLAAAAGEGHSKPAMEQSSILAIAKVKDPRRGISAIEWISKCNTRGQSSDIDKSANQQSARPGRETTFSDPPVANKGKCGRGAEKAWELSIWRSQFVPSRDGRGLFDGGGGTQGLMTSSVPCGTS